MDYKQIQELIKTMLDSDLTSMEIEFDGALIKLKRDNEEPKEKQASIVTDNKMKETTEIIKNDETVTEKIALEAKEDRGMDDESVETIISPIVGTFYSSSGPEKEDYVKIGSKVKKGAVLCIIEAMKLMNEIDSDVDGEVIDILVKNGQMVEYGQPLFKIKKI